MIAQVVLACMGLCTQAEAEAVVAGAVWWGAYHGVAPELILAVGETESRFNPRATGKLKEWGVFQLMPGTPWSRRARKVCARTPHRCIDAQAEEAALLLADGLKRCRRKHAALRAYNERGGACKAETSGYSRRVMRKYVLWQLIATEGD